MMVKGYLLVFTRTPTGVIYRTYRHSNKNFDDLFDLILINIYNNNYLGGFKNYTVGASHPVVHALGGCSGRWCPGAAEGCAFFSFAHRSRFGFPFQLLVTPDQTLRKKQHSTIK